MLILNSLNLELDRCLNVRPFWVAVEWKYSYQISCFKYFWIQRSLFLIGLVLVQLTFDRAEKVDRSSIKVKAFFKIKCYWISGSFSPSNEIFSYFFCYFSCVQHRIGWEEQTISNNKISTRILIKMFFLVISYDSYVMNSYVMTHM